MLFKVTVKSITGRPLPSTTQSVVLNSENCYDIEAYGSDTRLRYVVNPSDRRDKALLITIDETIASVLAAANTAYGDIWVKLPIETTVGGATTDRYIPVKSITWAEAVSDETDHVYIDYNIGGFKTTRVMVPFSLTDIVYVGSTGTSSK
jgi:hypothetical protein